MTDSIRKPRSVGRRAVLASLAAMPAAVINRAEAQQGGGFGTAEKPIQLRMIANSAFSVPWQNVMVPEFNKKFPHIKVQIDGLPYNEQLAKIMLDITGDKPTYDLYAIDDPWVPQVAETKQLLELKKDAKTWTAADYDWDDFNPAPLAASEWKGGQYGVPLRCNMLLRFYNKTHYQKAGLPEPDINQTWREFIAQAPKLVQDVKGTGGVNAWAIATYFTRDSLTPTIWQAILNAHGAELIDAQGKPGFNNPTGVKALQTHIDLLQWAPPGAKAHGFTESLQAFRQGQVANMFQWGSVYKGTAVDPGATTLKPNEVGIMVMPVGSNSPGIMRSGTHRGIWNGCVSRKSPNQQAAWAMLQWLSSKEGEYFHSSVVGAFPARKSTLSRPPAEAWQAPVFKTLQHSYEIAAAGRMWRPRSAKSDQAQTILADETARAFNGDVKVAEALASAASKIERLRL
ncbi:MAG: sugar ABC transporter substrate-binding protein [Alphaproteobacteria bacterium]|nr:sugar ABC transporter substrate-binding protein [Alphaproteobacteria bacterium]